MSSESPVEKIWNESSSKGETKSKTEDSENRCKCTKNEKPEIHQDCLQLGDTTLNCSASQLCKIFEYYDPSKLSPPHTLFLLVLLVAVESGFITRTLLEHVCAEFHNLLPTSTFDVENVLHFCSHMPAYEIDVDDTCFHVRLRLLLHKPPRTLSLIFSLLTAIVTGEFMIVTLTPDPSTKLPGKSTCLCISRFVISKFTPKRLIHHHLRKLDQLASQLRTDVFLPVRNSQLELLNRYPYPGLNGMPPELLSHIMQYLDDNNLNKLANVNTALRNEVFRIQGKSLSNTSYIVDEAEDTEDNVDMAETSLDIMPETDTQEEASNENMQM